MLSGLHNRGTCIMSEINIIERCSKGCNTLTVVSRYNIKTTLGKGITSQDEHIQTIDNDEGIILKQVKTNKTEIIKRLDELENKITKDIKLVTKMELLTRIQRKQTYCR